MDPAEEAALYLTSTFEKMMVPCRVNTTGEAGKHIVATADIPAERELFEEAPIVSWPAQGYVALGIPFCSHCLRQQSNSTEEAWRSCDGCGSCFCSETCESSSKIIHRILCGVLPQLREEKEKEEEAGRPDGYANSRCYKPITKESLARCVAWVVARIATAIKQQQFSGEWLEKQHTERDGGNISRQLFHIACAPFNRLVDAPKGTEFADVDAALWYSTVDRLLREPCRTALLEATSPPQCSNEEWADEIVDALLRHDTLETFLGQMSLNSQAINGFILHPSSGEASCDIPPVEWVLKGGAIYTLQSAFNHSCDPNMMVTAVDGTHDITLRTLRPIKAGEELTIAYIPLEKNSTPEQRNAKLKGYFFTCRCPRCEEEKRGEGEKA